MKASADDLIAQLLEDPERFARTSRANALARAYLGGYPLETLKSLLASDHPDIQRTAAYVLSELGLRGSPVSAHAVALLSSADRQTCWYALEAIFLGSSVAERVGLFSAVLSTFTHVDEVIRRLAMRLASAGQVPQWEAAAASFARAKVRSSGETSLHREGARLVLAGAAGLDRVRGELVASEPLRRRYGAVAAHRLAHTSPSLERELASSDDPDVRALVGA